MQKFCPKCGNETDGLGPRGLCEDCYTEEHELLDVPDRLTVTVCEGCSRAKIGPDWVEFDGMQELLYHVLDHHIEGEHVVAVRYDENDDPNAPQDYDITVLVERRVEGEPLQEEIRTALVIEKDQCPTCAKFQGGYYTYVVQLRTDNGDVPEDVMAPLMERAAALTDKERDHFIADVKELKHGFDIYVSTRTMAEELLKELENHYKVEKTRSKELVGEEQGQRVYRSVISARIITRTSEE